MNFVYKQKLVVISFILVLIIMTVGIVGIVNAQSVIDEIISRGKILVGMACDEPPISFLDEKGKPSGYQVEIAKDLANTMGVKLEIVELSQASRVPFLNSDKVDIVISNFTRTLERALVVDFSIPYYKTGIVLIVPEGSKIKSVADLLGLNVGAVRGTTGAKALEEMAKEANILTFEFGSDLYLALKQGKVDAIADDMVMAQYYKKTNGEKLEVCFPFLLEENICIGVKKGKQDLLNWVDLYIYNLHISGKNAEYYKKYLGEEPPKFIIPWTLSQ